MNVRYPFCLFQSCLLKTILLVAGLMSALPLAAFRLGMLGEEPDWSLLEKYQETMTWEEFKEALESVYLPYGYNEALISVYPGYALIRKDGDEPEDYFKLRFRSWEPNEALTEPEETEQSVAKKGALSGLVIAIDPGHIGGMFSAIERRYFQIGEDPPVKEGELTLVVAKKLKILLEANGASVTLVRTENQPVTKFRPEDFQDQAEAVEQQRFMEEQNVVLQNPHRETDWFRERVLARAEMLFYLVSEIQSRAKIVNEQIKPDLTLALHFNVSPWPEETQQILPEENHLHLIVHGTYTPAELALDDVRLHLLQKLLSRNHEKEIPISASVAKGLAKTTSLPAFRYGGRNASNQGGNPYLWARNLLANRLYEGPVIFCEAYCANSKEAYTRIQMGDYEGLRDFSGVKKQSLFKEYAEGITQGLVDYYSSIP